MPQVYFILIPSNEYQPHNILHRLTVFLERPLFLNDMLCHGQYRGRCTVAWHCHSMRVDRVSTYSFGWVQPLRGWGLSFLNSDGSMSQSTDVSKILSLIRICIVQSLGRSFLKPAVLWQSKLGPWIFLNLTVDMYRYSVGMSLIVDSVGFTWYKRDNSVNQNFRQTFVPSGIDD